MSKTPIEWTERTWNPVRGCSPVSPGCAHCYAEKTAGRFCGPGKPFEGFVQIGKNGNPGLHWTGKVELIEHMLDVPLRTRKPTTWFVNSMSDLFHENLPDGIIDRVFAVMALCPQHTFQVLTKRSKRMRDWFTAEIPLSGRDELVAAQAAHTGKIVWDARGSDRHAYFGCGQIGDISNRRVWPGWPLRNVWLGVSVEDRERKSRIDDLRGTPAAVRFISFEPLLEDVGGLDLHGIHLAIWGGESGAKARPSDVGWIRNGMRQADRDGCLNFVKQLGADPFHDVHCTDRSGVDQSTGLRIWPHSKTLWQGCEAHTSLNDRKGGDMDEWPGDLRVRQMPAVAERPRFVR